MTNTTMPLRSAIKLAEGLARQDFTSEDILAEVMKRAKSPAAAAVFTSMMPETALQEARASDARRRQGTPRSAWDGVPVVWKDLLDITGTVTTAGAAVRRDAPPATHDARLVAQCRALGLVSVGKTNMSEFAYSGLGLNPHFGTPRNPAAALPDRVPGGSSSGSAVAVAAGIVPLAIGSDTAGSVRVPASFCGIWGFKASQAHYSLEGSFPLSRSLDSLGTFANDVEDLVRFDALICGENPDDSPARAIADLSFLIPDSVVFDGVAPDILARFDQFVRRLRDAGAQIERAAFSPFAETADLFRDHGTLAVAEAYTHHYDLLHSDGAAQMDQRVRRRIETATGFTARDYVTLQWARERLMQDTARILGDRQLLFPTVAITAPSIPVLEADDDLFAETNALVLRNTMLGSYLEMPGVSIPDGADGDGLPIGALVSGVAGSDAAVLASSRAIGALMRTF
ncbi:amidase family protein [Oceaniglobus ichthyenteri]|uniref:amidase family protein n=1 Tax=Oceaniglobus ichthyenteri TaxID=2136177 RepID=UPI000D3CFA8C|nr:amidase family protein [Oceaniglobus ichthyenteri]